MDSPHSKIARFPEYKKEYAVNKGILIRALKAQQMYMKKEFQDLLASVEVPYPYIKYRLSDLLVSVTDDLIRYARYHKIDTDKRELNGEEVYSISEPVRASYFAKWILKLKPAVWDTIIDPKEYRSSKTEDPEWLRKSSSHAIMHCNEHLALVMLAVLINEKTETSNEIKGFQEFFSGIELSTVYYALRYRVYHQDSYTLLFYKIATQFEELI